MIGESHEPEPLWKRVLLIILAPITYLLTIICAVVFAFFIIYPCVILQWFYYLLRWELCSIPMPPAFAPVPPEVLPPPDDPPPDAPLPPDPS